MSNMEKAARILSKELISKGIHQDTSHLLIDILPLYIIHPEALEKLCSIYKGWSIATEVYRSLFREISYEARQDIFRKVERIRENTPPTDYLLIEKCRTKHRKGYLSIFAGFEEVKDLLDLSMAGGKGGQRCLTNPEQDRRKSLSFLISLLSQAKAQSSDLPGITAQRISSLWEQRQALS